MIPLPFTVTVGRVPAMAGGTVVLAATRELALEHRRAGRLALNPDQTRLLSLVAGVFRGALVESLWVAPLTAEGI